MDPVKDEILHVDLIHIAMDKVIKVSIPVDIIGEAVGVKTEGGFVDLMLRELEVECLPNIIPESIDIDISGLHMHQSLKVEDIILPDGVKMISEPDAVIVVIAAPTKEEPKAEEEMEEGLEEAAEGEEEGGQEEEGDEEPRKGA
jgi:large subunit ribosomal protein L25